MKTCDSFQEALTLLCSGDLPAAEAREVEEHLATCTACAREHRALSATLKALEPSLVYPRESEVDWDRFAAGIAARVGADGARVIPLRRAAVWLRPAVLARAAAVVLAVGLGVVAWNQVGIWTETEPPSPPAAGGLAASGAGALLPEDFQRRLEYNLAREDTREYLEASRAVLLSVLEAPVRCARDEIDIAAEREKSIQLIRRKKLLRDDLSRPELARAAELCDRLEGILTEISTLTNCADLERIQQLRDAVRRGQLLVKIGVVEKELGGYRA